MKKLFTLIIVTLLAITNVWGQTIFKRVKDLNQLSDGAKIILARDDYKQGSYYYLSIASNMNSTSIGINGSINNRIWYLDYVAGASIDISKLKDTDTKPINVMTLHRIDDQKWAVQLSNGKYLSFYRSGRDWVTSVATTDLSDENLHWTISLNDDGNAVLVSVKDPERSIRQKKNGYTGAMSLYKSSDATYQDVPIYVQMSASSLEVSTSELDLGTSGSGTFTVTGANLDKDVTITLDQDESDDGFAITPLTIAASDEVNEVITVTYTGNVKDAMAFITVASGELSNNVTVLAQPAPVDPGQMTIYIDKNSSDYYIWAWDAINEGSHYCDNWPGKPVSDLPTTTIGNGVEVYYFTYDDGVTGHGLLFNKGSDQNQTDYIAPNNHEIFYLADATSYRIGVPIDEVIFPDKYFRFALGTFPITNLDLNSDGVLHPDEIAVATSLKFGTDYFSPLRQSYAQYGLDSPSSPSDFTGIGYLYALTDVDISGDDRLGVVPCPINANYVDLTQNTNLVSVKISVAPDLKRLMLPETNTLKSLEVGDWNGEDLSTHIIHGGIRRVSEIDVTKNPSLEKLIIRSASDLNNRITTLDLSQNTMLKLLEIGNEPIAPIDLSANTAIETLIIDNTAITELNLEPLSNLNILHIENNYQLTKDFNLSSNPELSSISIINQDITNSVDLTGNTKLESINVNKCDRLTSFTTSDLSKLEKIKIESNVQFKDQTIDLTTASALKELSIVNDKNTNLIKGMGSHMSDLNYVVADYNKFDGNVLDLTDCAKLHNLSVIDCSLDKLVLKNCSELGSQAHSNVNTQAIFYANYLRALDLTGVDLNYNWNLSDNTLFLPSKYVSHKGYNSQITPELTPNVALVYHDRWAETPNYTYLVYVRLEQNPNDCYPSDYEADPSLASEPVLTLNGLFNKEAASRGSDVDNVGFDYQRVKLWSRFSQTQEGPVLDVHGTNEIHALTGVASPTWDENTTTDLSHVDPSHVLGKILSLGMYSVPCGHDREYHLTTGQQGTTAYVEPAYISGTVSYLYSTLEEWEKEAEVTPVGPSPMPQRDGGTGEDLDVYAPYNGAEVTSETDYYKGITVQNNAVVEKYDNAIPFKFDWKVELTNDPESIVTAIKGIHGDLPALIEEIQYYNVMGQMSHKPFEGVNIVVTRYSDGTTTTQKVIR